MKQHIKSLDFLRALAILSVLMIHTTTRTLEAGKFDLIGFPFTIFLNQVSRFAVPLFFVISGFLLEVNSPEKIDYFLYFKKRFGKIGIPYLFWSAIYYLLVYNQNQENFLRVIWTGSASYQLYFIPSLCIFYLLFPFFHKIYKIIAYKWIFLTLLFLQIWLLYQDYFIKTFRYDDPIRITILGFFFFISGIVAAHNKEKIKKFIRKRKYILFLAMIATAVYIYLEGKSGYLATGNYITYYSQWRPSILIYTILVALVFYYFFEKEKLRFSAIEKFSKLSFFVYFIHIIVLETAWSLFGNNIFILLSGNSFGKVLFDLFFFGIVTFYSFFIAYLIHKIPNLNKITG